MATTSENYSTPPKMPPGLHAAGRALWRSFIPEYAPRPDELAVLREACRTADYIAALDKELKGKPLTALGSQGQVREHPLLSERRMQSAHLARLLNQLRLREAGDVGDADDGEEKPTDRRKRNRTTAARKAANARWGTQ
jgi:hypothetical protein